MSALVDWPRANAASSHAGAGCKTGMSLASFLRFWAVASKWNSSRAPFGPRSRNRSRRRMRLRWASSISIFLRCLRDLRRSSDLAMSRAMSRAPSWIERDLSGSRAWAAARFKGTAVAIVFAGAIEQRRAVVHQRSFAGEHLVARTAVDAAVMVIGELGAREGTVDSRLFIQDR